jgi:hypothetical protein
MNIISLNQTELEDYRFYLEGLSSGELVALLYTSNLNKEPKSLCIETKLYPDTFINSHSVTLYDSKGYYRTIYSSIDKREAIISHLEGIWLDKYNENHQKDME